MTETEIKRPTEFKDKNGTEIREGDTLLHPSFDGDPCEFVVQWSDYRKAWIGANDSEIYDLATTNFPKAIIKTQP